MTTIGRVGSSSTTKNENGDRKKKRAGLEEATREQQEGIERERERKRKGKREKDRLLVRDKSFAPGLSGLN